MVSADFPGNSLDSEPLLTKKSILWLDEHLNKDMVGVEYGGGGSTIWLLKRLRELYTIEANPKWAILLLEKISENQDLLDKWRLYFTYCNWQIDDQGNRWYMRRELSDKKINILEDSYCQLRITQPSFILVDGSIRYKSLVCSVQMLNKNGGILCVDNMELPARQRYVCDVIPSNWKRYDFHESKDNIPADYESDPNHNGQWITSIWVAK